jgi:tetratricopeptide (TPR) repeat protein
MISTPMTQSNLAYQYYLKGQNYWKSGYDYILATEMFSKAIEEDPSFAAAYARRAVMHAHAYHFKNLDDWLSHAQLALDDVNRANQLNSNSIELNFAKAIYYYMVSINYDQSIKILNELKEYAPNMAELYAYVAFNQRRQGKWEESIIENRRAIQLEPFNVVYIRDLCQTYNQIREFDKSIEIGMEGLERVPDYQGFRRIMFSSMIKKTGNLEMALEASGLKKDDIPELYYSYSRQFDQLIDYVLSKGTTKSTGNNFHPKTHNLALYYHYKGDVIKSRVYADSAINLLEKKLKENPLDHRLPAPLSKCYAIVGDREKAIAYAKKAIEMLPVKVNGYFGIGKETELAKTYVLTGDYDLALDQIEYLLSIPGFLTYGDLWIKPEYYALRDHPRFKEIISQCEDLQIL